MHRKKPLYLFCGILLGGALGTAAALAVNGKLVKLKKTSALPKKPKRQGIRNKATPKKRTLKRTLAKVQPKTQPNV